VCPPEISRRPDSGTLRAKLTVVRTGCYRRAMALRPIVLYPDPVLLTPTEPVAALDDDIRTLVRDMVDTRIPCS